MLQQNNFDFIVHIPEKLAVSRLGSGTQQIRDTTEKNCSWLPVTDGQIPAHAVPGGYEKEHEEPYYVGRTYYQHGETGAMFQIPGKIHPSHECIYFAYGGRENSSKTFDVLVNRDGRQNFKWVFWSGGRKIPPNAVVGGYQDTKPLYIGRHLYEGAMVVGKIEPAQKCLHITYAGREIDWKSCEMLVLMLDGDAIEPTTATDEAVPGPTPNSQQQQPSTSSSSGSAQQQGVTYNIHNYHFSNSSGELGFRPGFVHGHQELPPPPYPVACRDHQPCGSSTKSMEVGDTTANNTEKPAKKKDKKLKFGVNFGAIIGGAVAGAHAVSSLLLGESDDD